MGITEDFARLKLGVNYWNQWRDERPSVIATASWKPPDSNVGVAASKLREERRGPAASVSQNQKWLGTPSPGRVVLKCPTCCSLPVEVELCASPRPQPD